MPVEDPVILNYSTDSQFRRPRPRPIVTILIFLPALVPLALFMHFHGPFLYVLSGDLFRAPFDRIHAGAVLDQPTIGKWYVIFTFFALLVLPYVLIVRWLADRFLTDRTTRRAYWAFAIPAVAICLYLLILLTLPFYWLLQYIHELGFTPRRIKGLTYGISSYLILLAFFFWVIGAPKRR